jgi:peptide deformylase
MAILKIARMGHQVLSCTATAVDDPKTPYVHRLIQDMIETLADTGGVGLAAPQVHVSKRIVIFHVPESRVLPSEESSLDKEKDVSDNLNDITKSSEETIPMTILINPIIKAIDEEVEFGVEGCLSLPGMLGMVPRYKRIRYEGLGPDGSIIQRDASGFHARVVQHECDHLDGILYPMRMTDLSTFGYSDELSSSGNLLRKENRTNDNG